MFKRIYHVVAVLFVLCLAVPAIHADYYDCRLRVIEDYSVEAGGVEWRHIVYGWDCDGGITVIG